MSLTSVNIRPGVSVLSVLQHLNYKPWFALAEFVDNAVQSYLGKQRQLARAHGRPAKLRVSIEIQPGPPSRIIIRDNAAGIPLSEYERAFRPAAPPADRSGLSEFGMGMKSAACWFASRWRVTTSALLEPVQRVIAFDIDRIVADNVSELRIEEGLADSEDHYTIVELEDLHKIPAGRTIGKIKEHLTDIYRVFVRNGTLELVLDGKRLEYPEPEILTAPFYRDAGGDHVCWRKEIDFDLGDGMRVQGFAALRKIGSTSRAGFALFRRGRLIQGSGDEGYRPPSIFGQGNTYRSQRLFGELHLEGFQVSHTKDGFKWDDNEAPFLDLLREHLDANPLPLLRQAEGHRSRPSRSQLKGAAESAVKSTAEALEQRLQATLASIELEPPVEVPPPTELPASPFSLADRTIAVTFRGEPWNITVELVTDDASTDWLSIADNASKSSSVETARELKLRVSLAHPFMLRFAGTDPEDIDALLRVAAALAVAEVLTREGGHKGGSIFLQNMNDILLEALSQP